MTVDPGSRSEAEAWAPPTVKAVAFVVVDRPRDTEFAWLRKHARDYAGQWVALDGSRPLGVAFQMKDLLQRMAPADRARRPLFHRVDAD